MIVPGLINGRQMLGCFLDQGQEDETEELIGKASVDDGVDLVDEKVGEQGDEDERDDKGDDAFGEGEFGFRMIFVSVEILFFVFG